MSYYRASIPVQDASAERDTSKYCVELEGWFLTSLLGLSWALSIEAGWSGTEEEISLAIDAAEEQQLALMGIATCNGVASMEVDSSGYLVSIDQQGNRTYTSNTITSAEIEKMPETQSETNTNNNVCAGVNYLVDRLLADVLFSLDQAQYVVDQFKTAAEALTAIGNAIPLWEQSFGTLIDGWEEWAVAAAELTISTLKIAYSDPAVKEKLRENLYCNITAHVNNVFQESDYFSAVFDLPLLESQSALLEAFFAGFYIPPSEDIFSTVLRWYNLGSLNSDATCEAEFGCNDQECYEWDFAVSDGGWTWYPESPSIDEMCNEYVPGVGWRTTVSDGEQRLRIEIAATDPLYVFTGAIVEFSPSIPGGGYFIYLAFSDGALGTYQDGLENLASGVAGQGSPLLGDGEIEGNNRRIMLDLASNGTAITVSKITLLGYNIGLTPNCG